MKWPAPLSPMVLFVAALVTAPEPASAQIYRWLDADGDIHYSQGIDSVPVPCRPKAVIIGYDRPSELDATGAAAPEGEGRVTFVPGQPIMVATRVNGRDSAQLMVDTGAARTVISPAVLNSLGVSFDNAVPGSLKGVTGQAEVVAVRVESLEVSGMKYGPLAVISHDTGFGPGRGDGLLGRDFLDHFTLTIDNAAGVLTLTPR